MLSPGFGSEDSARGQEQRHGEADANQPLIPGQRGQAQNLLEAPNSIERTREGRSYSPGCLIWDAMSRHDPFAFCEIEGP